MKKILFFILAPVFCSGYYVLLNRGHKYRIFNHLDIACEAMQEDLSELKNIFAKASKIQEIEGASDFVASFQGPIENSDAKIKEAIGKVLAEKQLSFSFPDRWTGGLVKDIWSIQLLMCDLSSLKKEKIQVLVKEKLHFLNALRKSRKGNSFFNRIFGRKQADNFQEKSLVWFMDEKDKKALEEYQNLANEVTEKVNRLYARGMKRPVENQLSEKEIVAVVPFDDGGGA